MFQIIKPVAFACIAGACFIMAPGCVVETTPADDEESAMEVTEIETQTMTHTTYEDGPIWCCGCFCNGSGWECKGVCEVCCK
jgi:hypothetical protein